MNFLKYVNTHVKLIIYNLISRHGNKWVKGSNLLLILTLITIQFEPKSNQAKNQTNPIVC